MRKAITIFILIVFSFLLQAACLHRTQPGAKRMRNISQQLLEKQPFEKQHPFHVRPFSSYLKDRWIGNAISYGCYRKGQAPDVKGPSSEQILEDLNILKQYWNLIRIYGADDDARRVLDVIKTNQLPFKVMLGVWVANEEKTIGQKESNIKQVLCAIELANQYEDIIAAINVGNESQVFWSFHKMDPQNLIQYIRAVRNNTTIPVTTADDYNFWNKPESKLIADEIDFIVTHIYPLWNGKTLDIAFNWLNSMYNDIKSKHPDKTIVIGETGWATNYNASKKGPGEQGSLVKGKVGLAAQEEYLIKHNEWVNTNKVTTFLFEAFDEPWKGGGEDSPPNEIEKHWGIFYENRSPKESFLNYLKHKNDLF
jgi:exo-beta-1,3-glucanase (GH17 family)